MKNFKQLIFLTLTFLLFSIGVKAQTATQTILRGDVKNYSVDTSSDPNNPSLNDQPNGTDGSTYTWTVFNSETPAVDITSTLTITNNNSTSGHAITIDWGTTPSGTYTLKVLETTATCSGEEKMINVIINPRVILIAPTVEVCSNASTEFKIEGAEPGSTISYTVTGGTTTSNNPITIDANGEARIQVTPTAGSTSITVTLTQMRLASSTVINIDPQISQTVDVTIITTSEISFD